MASKKFIRAAIVAVLLVGVGMWIASRPSTNGVRPAEFQAAEDSQSSLATRIVTVADQTYVVELAETTDEQALGLGNRDSLPEASGMLFPFRPAQTVSFWMKGMRFPLDIVWIAKDRVIGVAKNVPVPPNGQPSIDLPTYSPPSAVDYVLELNAGQSQFFDIGAEVTVTPIEST